MRRIKNGWQLTKKSWGVLRDDPHLIRFPVYGTLIALLVGIVFIAPGAYFWEVGPQALGAVLAAVGIYLAAFATYFYAVGLAATADRQMRGEQADVSYGIGVAKENMSQVAGWAFFATVVSWAVRFVQERFGAIGDILGAVLAAGWALISFLVVPVIAIEGLGPWAALKRSASLFRRKWGEQITGNIAIGGIVFLLGFLPGALLIAAGVVLWSSSGPAGAVLLVVGAIVMIVAALIQQALSAIFGVALYRYAAEGRAIGAFSPAELESAVRLKKGRRGGGPAPAGI